MNIDKLQQKLIRTTAMNAAVLVMFTLTQIIFFSNQMALLMMTAAI